jgi:hypothetical protein
MRHLCGHVVYGFGSIASSAFSLRSRFSSSRSFSLNEPSPSRARRSRFTHRPSVPSFSPSSRATCAIGLHEICDYLLRLS